MAQVAQEFVLKFMADFSDAIKEFETLQAKATQSADKITAATEKGLEDLDKKAKLTGDSVGGLAEKVALLKNQLGVMASTGNAGSKQAQAMADSYKNMASQLKYAQNPLVQFASQSKILSGVIDKIPNSVLEFSSALGAMVPGVGSAVAALGRISPAILGIISAYTVLKTVLTIGMQFNMMIEREGAAFTTMLKDAGKAKALIEDLKTLSTTTPVGVQEGAASAKQLLAYGFAQKDIITNLKMMKTLAVATNTSLSDITYVYGTLRAQGQAYTRDLMQFAMRGIPIYENLAHVMGVSVKQVRALTEAGKIGFPQVEKALERMTGAGGQFNGLLESYMKTTSGVTEKLNNDIAQAAGSTTGWMNDLTKAVLRYVDAQVVAFNKTVKTIRLVAGLKPASAPVDYGTSTFTSEQQREGQSMVLRSTAVQLRAPLDRGLALSYETLANKIEEYAKKTRLSWEDAARFIAQGGSFTQAELDKILTYKDKYKTFWQDWQSNVNTAASDLPDVFRTGADVLNRSLGAMSGAIDGEYKKNVEKMVGIWDAGKKELVQGTGEFGQVFTGDAEKEAKEKWLKNYIKQIKDSIYAEMALAKAATGEKKKQIDIVMQGWKEELDRAYKLLDSLTAKTGKPKVDKYENNLNLNFDSYIKFRETLKDINKNELPEIRTALSQVTGVDFTQDTSYLARIKQELEYTYQRQQLEAQISADKIAASRNTIKDGKQVAGELTDTEKSQLDAYIKVLEIQKQVSIVEAERTYYAQQYEDIISGTGEVAKQAKIDMAKAVLSVPAFTKDLFHAEDPIALIGDRLVERGKQFATILKNATDIAISGTDIGKFKDFRQKQLDQSSAANTTAPSSAESFGSFTMASFATELLNQVSQIKEVAEVLNYVKTIVTAMVNVLKTSLSTAFKPMADLLKIVGATLGVILVPIVDFIGKIIKLICDGIESMLTAMGMNTSYLKTIADSDLYDTILASLKNLYEVGALSGPEYEARIAALGASNSTSTITSAFDPNSGIGIIMNSLVRILNSVFDVISSLFSAIEPVLPMIGQLLDCVMEDIGAVLKTVADVLSVILPALKPLITAIATVVGGIVKALSGALTPILTIISDVIGSPLFTGILTWITDVFAAQITAWGAVCQWLTGTVAGILKFLYGVLTGNADARNLGWNMIKSAAESLVNGLIDALNYIINGLNALIHLVSWNTSIPQVSHVSFAVGAGNLPYDYYAQVHKGETIIPEDFASAIRNGDLTLSGKGESSSGTVISPTIIVQGSVVTERELVKVVADGIKKGVNSGRIS